jgi:peptidoglycan/LPS O-acetylase OafA/YrhL
MANDAAARPEIPALTGLRFVAAFLVVLAHTDHFFAALQPPWLEYAWRVGADVGMTTFFVLSGFVIHYNYGHAIVAKGAPAIRSFLVARFARLYPLYLLALLIAIALSPSIVREDAFRQWCWRYLTMSQDWTPTLIDGRYVTSLYIGSAWSISAEAGLYIFYLVLATPLNGLRSVHTTLWAIITLSIAGFVFVGGYATGLWLDELLQPDWWFGFSPFGRLPEFFLGALIAQIVLVSIKPDFHAERHARWIGLFGAVWIIGLFLACYEYPNLQVAFGFAPGIAAAVYFLARYRSRATVLLDTPIVLALGDASYSIYMLHGFAIGYVMRQSPYLSPLPRIAMAWGLTTLISIFTYRYFEAPAPSFIRRTAAHVAGTKAGINPRSQRGNEATDKLLT